jgi:hypothetical protein
MWGALSDDRMDLYLLEQKLLDLANAAILGSKCRRNHDHILLSHLRLTQRGGSGPRIYIPQEQGVYPRALGSLSSPLTAYRTTVEVF